MTAAFGLAAPASANAPDASAQRIWLDAHNQARADFGSGPLKWSDELSREARAWAQQLAREQRMRHASRDERNGRGENLWMGTRGYFTPGQMIDGFVSEKQHFVPGRFPQVSRTGRWSDVGHYTQIVWPETREVGCALAPGAQYEILVCRYWPAGNRMGDVIAPAKRVATR
ncbi:MAG: CAP domain-containing protein [Erythrobacter sp.]